MHDVYRQCSCGSGKKFKFCCALKAKEPYEPPRWVRRQQTAGEAYTFRVALAGDTKFHCLIGLPAANSLYELHAAIQSAFDWDDDHLYSFFVGKREYQGDPMGGGVDEIDLGSLGLKVGTKLRYLFDYGDANEFDVEVLEVKKATKELLDAGDYVYQTFGRPPEQYPS
jgi:Plasmid pRiA4b ORF-3-like protein